MLFLSLVGFLLLIPLIVCIIILYFILDKRNDDEKHKASWKKKCAVVFMIMVVHIFLSLLILFHVMRGFGSDGQYRPDAAVTTTAPNVREITE